MQLSKEKIFKKYKYIFESLKKYDESRELPFQRKRLDITLSLGAINKLKSVKEKNWKISFNNNRRGY